jgi:5-methylcytosine-specific restriction protein A
MPWKPAPARPKQRPRDTRKSAAERGYDWQWQKFRARYLGSNPLCMDCLPLVTAATDVHHRQKLRDRPELKYEDSNLVSLCSACHDKRTAMGE